MDQMDQQNACGEDLCKLCGERPIDRSTGNPEEYLCRECREERLKLRVPKWLVVALSIVCVVTIVMIGYLSTKLDKYTIGQETLSAGNEVLKEAYDLVDEKMPWSALVKIQEHLENNPENTDVALEGMRIAMKCGAYGSAAYFFNNYLADKGFTQEEINEMNVYADDISRYYDTYNATRDIMMGMQDLSADMSSEEIESARQEMKVKLLALEGREEYDSGLIEFYLGFYFSDSAKEAEDHMKNATEYLPVAAEAYGRLAVSKRNKGNFDEAEALIEKGRNIDGESTELARAKATVLLAKGEYAEALTVAEDLYKVAPDGMYVPDTYAVALYANGESAKLNVLINSVGGESYFDEDFRMLINGEISVRDYYVKGEK